MTNAPLVTLVTPAYNQARYLPETLDSVLAQTHSALEYIVIDDGSTDDTQQVIRAYDGRLTAMRHDNIGQARTLNAGWALARGRYLGYLSADDVLLPGAVARMVAVLEAQPAIVCAFPDSDLIDGNSRLLRRGVCAPFDLETVLVTQECKIGPGAIFRREAWEACGGWRADLRLAPDREFWMRLAAHGRIEFVDESLARYRMHPAANSFSGATEQGSYEFVRVLDDFFARQPVPPSILRRRNEAYAHAELLLARNALWRMDIGNALAHYRKAADLHAPFRGLATRLRLLRQGASKPAKLIYARVTGAR